MKQPEQRPLGADGVAGSGGGEILNPADYRILTATGSSATSSVAWSGLTYDGTTFSVSGSQVISSGITGSQVLRVEGTNGTLFTVTDDLSGSLGSFNNISGLPVFEVFADNTGSNLSSTIQYGDYSRRGFLSTYDTTINSTNYFLSFSHSTYNGLFIEYKLNTGTHSRAGNVTVVTDGTSSSIYDSYLSWNAPEIGDTSNFVWVSDISGQNVRVGGSVSMTYSVRAIIRAI